MSLVQQVNVATIVGSITQSGNAAITITSARMNNSPKSINVAVLNGDSSPVVATKVATALAFDVDVSLIFLIAPSGSTVILTERVAHNNDTTLNVASANGTCLGLTPEPISTTTVAGSGLDNSYITLDDVKATHELDYKNFTDYDVALTDVINAVSREIEKLCHQRFWVNPVAETRYFSPTQNDQCIVTNLTSLTTLATDTSLDRTYATTWATSDYDLYPYDATLENAPYWRIDITPNGNNTFNAQPFATPYSYPYPKPNAKYVKVVGFFGYPSVPSEVMQACLIWTLRTWARHSTPLGVTTMAEGGMLGSVKVDVSPLDPDIMQLLAHYITKITGVI